MKKILLLLSISLLFVRAEEWVYRARSPLLGELGTLKLQRIEEAGRYRIQGEAKSAGIVKTLSGNRRERYRSEGKIVAGKYRPECFVIERRSKKKDETLRYLFDDKTKHIQKERVRRKKGKVEKKVKTLKYWAPDDLATLFFNVLPPVGGKGPWDYPAAGAEKIDGIVSVRVPDPVKARKERKELGVPDNSRIVYLYSKKKLLGKKNRRIVAAFDSQGNLQKAYLIAVPVVGKIYVERIK